MIWHALVTLQSGDSRLADALSRMKITGNAFRTDRIAIAFLKIWHEIVHGASHVFIFCVIWFSGSISKPNTITDTYLTSRSRCDVEVAGDTLLAHFSIDVLATFASACYIVALAVFDRAVGVAVAELAAVLVEIEVRRTTLVATLNETESVSNRKNRKPFQRRLAYTCTVR